MGSAGADDSSQRAIEGDLLDVGNRLLDSPLSTDELLVLLQGDLHEYLKKRVHLNLLQLSKLLWILPDIFSVTFIWSCGGMNYLHEHKPEAIIHRDLEPLNILLDDFGQLKVADFGVSKLLRGANRIKEERPLLCQDASYD